MFKKDDGILSNMKRNVMLEIKKDKNKEMNKENIGELYEIMMEKGKEIFVKKDINDKMKDDVIEKLSYKCEEIYVEVLKLLKKELMKNMWEKEWIKIVDGKKEEYNGIDEY